MGIPFWALAIWISYLIVADPLHRHRMLEKERESTSTEGGDAHPLPNSSGTSTVGHGESGNTGLPRVCMACGTLKFVWY